MDKVKEELLKDLKKSNKERKLKLANKYGYATVEEYLVYLKYSDLKEKPVEVVESNKHKIHNVFILDASGSMSGSKYNNGVEGIKKLVESIKEDKLTDNTVTIIEFDSSYRYPGRYNNITRHYFLANCKDVIFKGRGANGGTPLYITLGTIINELLNSSQINKEDKVLLNVTTDGEDTDGFGEFTNLPYTLKKIQEENNFTVTFVGTEQDVQRSIRNLNIDRSNTLVHDNTGLGMMNAFEQTVNSRVMYSSSVSKGLEVKHDFYKREGKL